MENLAPQPGFNPRPVQPIVSCYTDHAMPTHIYSINVAIFFLAKMCVSSLASYKKHKVTVRFMGVSLIVSMEPASCNTSGMGGF